jgi:hypothetical protein
VNGTGGKKSEEEIEILPPLSEDESEERENEINEIKEFEIDLKKAELDLFKVHKISSKILNIWENF